MVGTPISEATDGTARLAAADGRGPLRYIFYAGFAVAFAVTALAIFLTTSQPAARPLASASQSVLLVLSLNLLLVLALTAVVGLRVWRLFGPGVSDAGVRLHRRFVILFAMAAVAPAIIVALFFGLLVTRGVEDWFSQRVRTVVENAVTVARSYVNEQQAYVASHIGPMADDLNRAEPLFERNRIAYSVLLTEQLAARDLLAVYVVDSEGRVLARAEGQTAPPYATPPRDYLEHADAVPSVALESNDLVRAVFRLKAYPDAFVYVVRPMGQGIVSQLRRSEEAVVAYRDADANRGRIQTIFVLSYVATALLVLVGSVWVGLSVATRIAAPIARLVQAAGQVSGGDLHARVDTRGDPEEIAVLSHAFNQMTSDLQGQQAALRAAGDDAELRRRFIEAVLSGVSAGVIGLDPAGNISAINARALTLLGLTDAAARGHPLAEAAPELAPIAARAAEAGDDAEEEVDVIRRNDTRRLRVRASSEAEGGLVLTFDDITRLVAAQRNAAWRDVARRIAHEIKNPLTPIQLSAERLRRKYRSEIVKDVETFDRCTDTIIRQVGDIGRMVDEFSAFARMPAPKFAAADAAELLRQAVFAQRVAYPDVTVDMEAPDEAIPMVCDAAMVGQALANVLKNAGEAVMARVLAEPEPAGRIKARVVADDTNHLQFEVEDNGVGLPSKDRDRLTEPYVTTREKGTGLGLAIVKRIAEEHGGELELTDARVGAGALAILRFPRAATAGASRPLSTETAA